MGVVVVAVAVVVEFAAVGVVVVLIVVVVVAGVVELGNYFGRMKAGLALASCLALQSCLVSVALSCVVGNLCN